MERKVVHKYNLVQVIPIILIQPILQLIRTKGSLESIIFLGVSFGVAAIFFFYLRRPSFIYSEQGITLVKKYGSDDPDFIPLMDISDIILDGKDKIDIHITSGKLVYLYPPAKKTAEIYTDLMRIKGLQDKNKNP